MHKAVIIAAALFGLSACGDTVAERAGSGALIGAGASVVANGDPVTGAVIGGVVGAVTNQSIIDLGDTPL
ncbi:MAG: hypothetical protein AAFR93_04510 [Pseudomonadota bacterium]